MDFDPAIILTIQGAAATSTGIAGVIQLGKTLIPALDGASARTYQQIAAVLALVVVAYAAVATNLAIDAINVGGLALAWYGIARLATATYDAAATVKAAVTKP